MFNDGQSPASIFNPIYTQIHSNRLNHELYSEPSFPAPQLYLLSHTLNTILSEHYTRCSGFKPTTGQDNYGFQHQKFTLQLVFN